VAEKCAIAMAEQDPGMVSWSTRVYGVLVGRWTVSSPEMTMEAAAKKHANEINAASAKAQGIIAYGCRKESAAAPLCAEWCGDYERCPISAATLPDAPPEANARTVAEKCAEIAESVPRDGARCEQLNLASQAWDEGQEHAAKAIRAFAATLPDAPQPGHRTLLADYAELQQLYGAAVLRLQELGEKSVSLQPATQRSEPMAAIGKTVRERLNEYLKLTGIPPSDWQKLLQALGAESAKNYLCHSNRGEYGRPDECLYRIAQTIEDLQVALASQIEITNMERAAKEKIETMLVSLRSETAPSGTAKVPEGWKEMASKMREIWCRRIHDLKPPITDEEIAWADEYIDMLDASPSQSGNEESK